MAEHEQERETLSLDDISVDSILGSQLSESEKFEADVTAISLKILKWLAQTKQSEAAMARDILYSSLQQAGPDFTVAVMMDRMNDPDSMPEDPDDQPAFKRIQSLTTTVSALATEAVVLYRNPQSSGDNNPIVQKSEEVIDDLEFSGFSRGPVVGMLRDLHANLISDLPSETE